MENIYESSYTALLAGLRGIKNECHRLITTISLEDPRYTELYNRIMNMFENLYKVLNRKIEAAERHRSKIKNYDTYLSFYNNFGIPEIMNNFEYALADIKKFDILDEIVNENEDASYENESAEFEMGYISYKKYLHNNILMRNFTEIYGDLHSLNKDYNPNTVLQKEGAAIRKGNFENQYKKDRNAERRLALMQEEQAQKQSRGALNYARNYAASFGKTLRSIGERCYGAFCSSPRAAARAAAAPLGSVPNTRRAVRSGRASSQPRQRPTRGGSRRTRKNMKRRGAK